MTEIQRLIRDPYAIYARHVLGLTPLPQPPAEPDARLRGIVLHDVADRFTRDPLSGDTAHDTARLLDVARDAFATSVPWPVTRHLWLARLERIAPDFLTGEARRQASGTIALSEVKAELALTAPVFTLVGKVDRIDRHPDGQLSIYDYKSGPLPKPKQMVHFDKQLMLEAMMVAQGAFGPETNVGQVGYIGLGAAADAPEYFIGPDNEIAPDIDTISAEFANLLIAFSRPEQGYASRRTLAEKAYRGDFDHLARYGEWDEADTPATKGVGQ